MCKRFGPHCVCPLSNLVTVQYSIAGICNPSCQFIDLVDAVANMPKCIVIVSISENIPVYFTFIYTCVYVLLLFFVEVIVASVSFLLVELKICNFRILLRYIKFMDVATHEWPAFLGADTFTRISSLQKTFFFFFKNFKLIFILRINRRILIINVWHYLPLRWEHCERRKGIYQKPPWNIWWLIRVSYRRSQWILSSEWRWVSRQMSKFKVLCSNKTVLWTAAYFFFSVCLLSS